MLRRIGWVAFQVLSPVAQTRGHGCIGAHLTQEAGVERVFPFRKGCHPIVCERIRLNYGEVRNGQTRKGYPPPPKGKTHNTQLGIPTKSRRPSPPPPKKKRSNNWRSKLKEIKISKWETPGSRGKRHRTKRASHKVRKQRQAQRRALTPNKDSYTSRTARSDPNGLPSHLFHMEPDVRVLENRCPF